MWPFRLLFFGLKNVFITVFSSVVCDQSHEIVCRFDEVILIKKTCNAIINYNLTDYNTDDGHCGFFVLPLVSLKVRQIIF
jgi:hypothetical protein